MTVPMVGDRRGDDFITWSNAGGSHGHVQGRRAGRAGADVLGRTEFPHPLDQQGRLRALPEEEAILAEHRFKPFSLGLSPAASPGRRLSDGLCASVQGQVGRRCSLVGLRSCVGYRLSQ